MALCRGETPILDLDLSSSRVKDTLGHTSTTAFSVDSDLLRYVQVMPMLFKSCCMVSIQFFRGLIGFVFELLISQCLGSLLLYIRRTCPRQKNFLLLLEIKC